MKSSTKLKVKSKMAMEKLLPFIMLAVITMFAFFIYRAVM